MSHKHDRDSSRDKEILKELREVSKKDDRILEELEEIERDVHPHLTQGKVQIMPKTIAVGEAFKGSLALLDHEGNPFIIDARYKVVPVASNPASVTFDANIAPNGDFSGVGVAADAGQTISATVTRPSDGAVITLTGDTLIITGVGGGPELASGAVVLS
jgi:hypothetical protein